MSDTRDSYNKFLLTIDCTNDAFQPTPWPEVATLLRAIADRVDSIDSGDYQINGGWAGHFQTILDGNGNDVGRYSFKPLNYK